MSQGAVLVVEDDLSLREALCDTLELAGYSAIPATDGNAAIDMLTREDVRMVVSDVQMTPMDGHDLLRRIKGLQPELPVVLMTAYGTIQKAVEAMRDGAVDYLVKPFEAEVLVNMVSRLIAEMPSQGDSGLVAEDEETRAMVALATRVAATDATVLITGESGSGKEVFARHIHANSPRAKQPFVAINCAAIPENMLEAVLFGYEKGAFTGAYQSNPGKFEQANTGTLLLDEISEMDLGLQAKLLRVLQEREVERLGGRKVISLDVRVLATSNRSLRDEVRSGRFREDLFYRLSVFPLHLAPLRSRTRDILPLARRIIERRCRGSQNVPRMSAAAEQTLLTHTWPGNVRELDNVIQRALILKIGDSIEAGDIRLEGAAGETPSQSIPPPEASQDAAGQLSEGLKCREQTLILETLRATNGSRKAAAERLGISARTLRYKLARLRESGIDLPA